MNIIAWDKETNSAIQPNRLPVDGEFAQFKNDTHTEYKHFYELVEAVIDAELVESEWVKSELLRTDELAKLLDYPHKDKLYAYRQELRDYMLDGIRPVRRLTPKGTLI